MANIYKLILSACLLLFSAQISFAQVVKIHLDEAGTLETKIEKAKYDLIKELTISGYINGSDLYDIRNMDNLEVLDLSEATILASGSSGTSTYTENNTISSGNFSNCEVRTLILPNSLLYIKYQAFYGANKLEKIVIGDNLKTISEKAFVNSQNAYEHSIRTCRLLKEFEVSENNPNFASVDGVLFDKSKSTLLFYPNMKSKKYIVPEGVTTISSRAFSCCDNLLEITLPQSLTHIGGSAFESCEMLLNITSLNPTPPEAAESLNGGVFYNVPIQTCILYVPQGSRSSYWIAPGWGVFTNIEELAPTGISSIYEENYKIEAVEGGINISLPALDDEARIYTTTGIPVYVGKSGTVPLETGIYIVKAGGHTTKVAVEK